MNKSPVVEFSERQCRSFRECCREKSLWTLEGESNTVPERTFFFCWISPLIPLDLGILSFMKTSQIKRTFSATCRSEARSLSETFYWSFTAALLTLETLKKTWEVTAQSGHTVQTTGGLLLRYCTTPPPTTFTIWNHPVPPSGVAKEFFRRIGICDSAMNGYWTQSQLNSGWPDLAPPHSTKTLHSCK